MSFVLSGSVGGSAQSFIKGKCCQDAGCLRRGAAGVIYALCEGL